MGRQVVLLTLVGRQAGCASLGLSPGPEGGVAAASCGPHSNCLYPFPIQGKRKNNKTITGNNTAKIN